MNYENIYSAIVQRRKQLKYIGLTENHHILPKSIYPELKNCKDNIVALSLREHLVCHKLLLRIYEQKYSKDSVQYKKMLIAFAGMTNYKRYSNYITSRDYERVRTEFHNAQSDILKTAWQNYPKEKMDKLKKKRSINSRGENNPMYHKDWRVGKTKEELRQHSLKTKIALANRTEQEKSEAIKKALDTKSKYTEEQKEAIRQKRSESIKKFNLEHPGFRKNVAKKSGAKQRGNKLMVNANNPSEEKRVLADDIQKYLDNGWYIKSEKKDITNAAYGRRWMYDPVTLVQVYPKKENMQKYIEAGYKFGNIKNYKLLNKLKQQRQTD